MAVTLSDVDHIALLARLGLRDEERHALRAELESISAHRQVERPRHQRDRADDNRRRPSAPLHEDRVTNGDARPS
jgi:Asp-tRNA(Asn)/Glu-tRNA(Gln) amidotransferase C subunit